MPNPITDSAQALLDAVVATIPNPPDRRYLSMGEPAYDCEQVAVWWGLRPSSGNNITQFTPVRCALGNMVDFNLAIVRCESSMNEQQFPTQEELTADAVAFADDAWALWMELYPQLADRSVFAGIPAASAPGADLVIGTITTETGSGGFAALRWSMGLQLAPLPA